jgi:NDP-sugar pyrophosphorylase family protein
MPVNQCIILAAGYGTRMGEIGKQLPKVMWPLFQYNLLETQILFASTLGMTKFYINIHFQADSIKISDELREKFTIELIREKNLLGSGGGIHNILKNSSIDKASPLLILNSDAYFMLTKKDIERSLESLMQSDAAVSLFPIPCLEKDSYNRLITKNNKLIKVSSRDDSSESNITYAGVAVCLPKRLSLSVGESSFFNSVANYKNNEVLVAPSLEWEFLDFGTSDRYFREIMNFMKDLKSKKKSSFIDFMTAFILKEDDLDLQLMSYNCEYPKILNFSNTKIDIENKSKKDFVIFDYNNKSGKFLKDDQSGIIYKNIFQEETK